MKHDFKQNRPYVAKNWPHLSGESTFGCLENIQPFKSLGKAKQSFDSINDVSSNSNIKVSNRRSKTKFYKLQAAEVILLEVQVFGNVFFKWIQVKKMEKLWKKLKKSQIKTDDVSQWLFFG